MEKLDLTVKEVFEIIEKIEVKKILEYNKWQRFDENNHGEIGHINQKCHWLCYLSCQSNPESLLFIKCYNRLRCAPMLYWLIDNLSLEDENKDALELWKKELAKEKESEASSFREKFGEEKLLELFSKIKSD